MTSIGTTSTTLTTSTSTSTISSTTSSIVTSTLLYPISSLASPNFGMSGPNQGPQAKMLFEMTCLEQQIEFAALDLSERLQDVLLDLHEGNHPTALLKAATLADMRCLERQLDVYKKAFNHNCATIELERRRALMKQISKYEREIILVKVAAGDDGLHIVQPEHLIQPAVQLAPQPKLVKVEPLKLPRYDGEDHSRYYSFKTNLDRILRCTNIPEDVWGNVLYSQLDGKALKYAGCRDNWQGRYADLWEKLDSRYANRWTIAAETIKCSIMSSPSEDGWQELIDYVDDQLDCITSIEQLGMTNAQLAINVLLMKLPEDFANAIRNGIRIQRHNKGLQDYKFTPEEFRDVVNDTVFTWRTTAPHRTVSTTVLQANFKQEDQFTCPSEDGGDYISGRGQGSPRDIHRGRGSHRISGKPRCLLCDEEHITSRCKTHRTAIDRRKKLIEFNRCPRCTREKHDGVCKFVDECRICGNGYHMDWLCPGIFPTSNG